MLSLQSIKRLPISVVRRVRKYNQLRQAAKRADCLLASYPKSGRTWLRYIMSNYLNEAHRVGADIDMTTTFKLVPNFDLDMKRGVPAFESDPSTSDIPMVLVTHLRHNRLLFQKRPMSSWCAIRRTLWCLPISMRPATKIVSAVTCRPFWRTKARVFSP